MLGDLRGEDLNLALTDCERHILRLSAYGMSDYRIAKKLKIETPNLTRSRKNALKKLECAELI